VLGTAVLVMVARVAEGDEARAVVRDAVGDAAEVVDAEVWTRPAAGAAMPVPFEDGAARGATSSARAGRTARGEKARASGSRSCRA
jgi:hypothetical protein